MRIVQARYQAFVTTSQGGLGPFGTRASITMEVAMSSSRITIGRSGKSSTSARYAGIGEDPLIRQAIGVLEKRIFIDARVPSAC